jgi:hypothetical protein
MLPTTWITQGDEPCAILGKDTLILFCVFICCLITGCCSYQANGTAPEVADYKAKHRVDFGHFVYILPIKLDTYQYLLANQLEVARRISSQMKVKFANTPGVQEFADSEFKEEMETCQKASQRYDELEDLAARGGAVCQFCWNDGKTQEMGLLVLKNGNIIERDVWITDFRKSHLINSGI